MMKSITLYMLAAVISVFSTSVVARDFVFVLTQQQSQQATLAEVEALLNFVVQQAPNDTATFIDADKPARIATFANPEEAIYNSAKARLKFNRTAVQALLAYAKQSAPVELPESSLADVSRYIAANISHGKPMDVVFTNSVLYHDNNAAALSMVNGKFPSDGFLNAPRHQSPFSVTENGLKGLRFHVVTGNSHFSSDLHEVYVQRFWQLFMTRQNASLHSWASDLSTVLNNLTNQTPALAPPLKHIDGIATDKLEMMYLRAAKAAQALFERPLATKQLSGTEISKATDVEIGIRWACACDLDLWVQPMPNVEPIYFGAPSSRYARLFKDYTDAPEGLNGFETVAFRQPIDLRAVSIAVNFYKGDTKAPVSLDMRISVNGKTYTQRYHLSAHSGNQGKDARQVLQGRKSSPYTVFITPSRVISGI